MVQPHDEEFDIDICKEKLRAILQRTLENFRSDNGLGPETEQNIRQAILISKQSEVDAQSVLNRLQFNAQGKIKAYYRYLKLRKFCSIF